jgi:gamma-glutamyltranspeptidase/glutathione hydrolase
MWGDSGIVVGGIPIPDSAGFQQRALAGIKPGDRLPDLIIDTIAFKGDSPVLATASIGASLGPETIRVLVGVLGQHQSLATITAAPPLLTMNDFSAVDKSASQAPVSIPQGAYGADFTAKLKALGLNIIETTTADAAARRGTLAAVSIDPITGKRTAVNQPGVTVFNRIE